MRFPNHFSRSARARAKSASRSSGWRRDKRSSHSAWERQRWAISWATSSSMGHLGVERLAGDPRQHAHLPRKAADDVAGGVQDKADDVDVPLAVGKPHPADDIVLILVEQ